MSEIVCDKRLAEQRGRKCENNMYLAWKILCYFGNCPDLWIMKAFGGCSRDRDPWRGFTIGCLICLLGVLGELGLQQVIFLCQRSIKWLHVLGPEGSVVSDKCCPANLVGDEGKRKVFSVCSTWNSYELISRHI